MFFIFSNQFTLKRQNPSIVNLNLILFHISYVATWVLLCLENRKTHVQFDLFVHYALFIRCLVFVCFDILYKGWTTNITLNLKQTTLIVTATILPCFFHYNQNWKPPETILFELAWIYLNSINYWRSFGSKPFSN